SRSQAIKQGGVLPITRTWIRRNIAMNASFGLDLLHDRVESNDLGLVVDKIRSVLMQKYDGDINIIPPRKPLNVLRVLANPSVEDVREYIRNGERTTWPRMDMIRNTTMISRTFRDCMHRLNKQGTERIDRKSTRLNSSHVSISYAVFCLKKKKKKIHLRKD